MAQRARGAGARPSDRRGARVSPRPPQASGPDLAAVRARVRQVVEPLIAAAGLDLEDLNVTRAGRRHVVRVTVDGDGGVSHDELSDVAHEISAALDAAEESGGELTTDAYTLEVSSPGIDRPLTQPRHWRRNVGRLVIVRAGDRTLTDRVVAADETAVTLDGAGAFAYADLGPGRVQVEFSRPGDEGDELTENDSGDPIDEPTDEEDGA